MTSRDKHAEELRDRILTRQIKIERYVARIGKGELFHQDCEDIASETIKRGLRAIEELEKEVPSQKIDAFLKGIAFNILKEWRKKRGRERAARKALIALGKTDVQGLVGVDEASRLLKSIVEVLHSAPLSYYRVFILRILGMKYRDIADCLGITMGATSSLLKKAREWVWNRLPKDLISDEQDMPDALP